MESHRRLPTYLGGGANETTNTITNTSIAARASSTDPDTLSRLVDALFPLLAAVYMNSANPNLGSLNADQLAESEAFAHASTNTWGGVSLEAWSSRLRNTQQGDYASDGPQDPRADVLDMMCEGSDSNSDTLAMLVLTNSVCLSQKCGITAGVCSTKPARRGWEHTEVLIDEDEGDDVDGELFRRMFDQVGNVCLIVRALLTAQSEIQWTTPKRRRQWRKAEPVHSD